MGAGKSTIGPILANTIGWKFYDLDKVIEKEEGKKVREIFEEKGEEYFRRTEADVLAKLSAGKNIIISLGGGTLANDENLNFIRRKGKIIYLKVSPEEAYKRLRFKRDRPVLNIRNGEFTKEELIDRINSIYEQRKKYYEKADLTIDTDNVSVGQTVDHLARIITKGLIR
jgi:shikimate kinase